MSFLDFPRQSKSFKRALPSEPGTPVPQPPRKITRLQSDDNTVYHVLATPPRRRRPDYGRRLLPPPPVRAREDREDWNIMTFVENLEKCREPIPDEFITEEGIPDLELGEPVREVRENVTHRTERVGGGVAFIAVEGEEAREREKMRRKRMKREGGVGGRKKRAAFKKGGGRKRGEDGRFV